MLFLISDFYQISRFKHLQNKVALFKKIYTPLLLLSVCEGTILTRERQKKDGMLILSPTQQGYSHVAGNGDVHSGAQNRTAPIS